MLTLCRSQAMTTDNHTYVNLISILVLQVTSHHLLMAHMDLIVSLLTVFLNLRQTFLPSVLSSTHFSSIRTRGNLVVQSHLTKSLPLKFRIYDHRNRVCRFRPDSASRKEKERASLPVVCGSKADQKIIVCHD